MMDIKPALCLKKKKKESPMGSKK